MNFSFEQAPQARSEMTPAENLFTKVYSEIASRHEKWEDEKAIEEFRNELLHDCPDMNKEMLSLFSELAVEINAVHQDGYLSKNEAKFLLQQLVKSKGRDNLTTLAVFTVLGERKKTKQADAI